ncbi:MAG: glycoside hydrolase family 2 TIM barrel-domain containing protein [Tepidisphaeraceae bacterium]
MAKVYVNGTAVGEHRGGYSAFALDITGALKDGDNELVVQVTDEIRSGLQAAGKQSHGKSEGCVYTRTTGIWQTVYLEAAGDTYLNDFVVNPDLNTGRVLFNGNMAGANKGVTVRVRAYADDQVVGEDTVPANWRSTPAMLKLSKVVAWEPGKPYLYDLLIETLKDGKVIDTVRGYFGFRKIAIEGNRFLINDKLVFQRLILDQGFYPDGIYTAPTDADLKKDIELSLAAGFDGARLHQKVFEPRLLYWADKLGYIVWGEYPSWGVNIDHPEAVRWIINEWREVLIRDRNHPAIVGWCLLNETGKEEYVARLETLLATTWQMDPTRPLLDSSGYTHYNPNTDVFDAHDYDQNPESFKARYAMFGLTGQNPWHNNPGDPRSKYRGQPFFVSEYGGISLKTERATGEGWCYNGAGLSQQDFLARYKGLTDAQLDNRNLFGFCYTQLTDVEQEQNGVYFYDRKPKYDPALLKAINARPAAYETQGPIVRHIVWKPILPTSQETAQNWRYTTNKPADNWFAAKFDDTGWTQAKGGFGTKGTPGAVIGTVWDSSDIWMRRTFRVEQADISLAALRLHHDEDVEVYLNGRKIVELVGFVTDYQLILNAALAKALVAGENIIAVHCLNKVGGQFVDVGIDAGVESKAGK